MCVKEWSVSVWDMNEAQLYKEKAREWKFNHKTKSVVLVNGLNDTSQEKGEASMGWCPCGNIKFTKTVGT